MTIEAFALPRVVDLHDLGELDDPIAENNGQSIAVRPLFRHAGYLIKMYVSPLAGPDTHRLDKLIALPGVVAEDERRLILEHTAWPVARVDSGTTAAVGCVLPAAPDKFRADVKLPTGVDRRYLDVDWLARPAEQLARRGLTRPGEAERRQISQQVMEVAALLARHNLVYSDWSYSNAFFSLTDWSAYVIDIDGCAERAGPNVVQPNWDDPLTPRDVPADTYTDRYRTALLVGRILTGESRADRMMHELAAYPDQKLASVLLDVLCSPKRRMRPPPSAVLAVLRGLPYLRVPIERLPLPPDPGPPPPSRNRIPDPPETRSEVQPPPSPEPRTRNWRPLVVLAWTVVAAVLIVLLVIATQNH